MKEVSTSRFILHLLGFTLVLFGLHFGAYALIEQLTWPYEVFFIYGYFVLLTLGMHLVLMAANRKSPQLFVNAFLGLMSGKMFMSLIIILLYLVLIKERPMAFGVNFLMLYLAFTAFEVVSLYGLLKKGK